MNEEIEFVLAVPVDQDPWKKVIHEQFRLPFLSSGKYRLEPINLWSSVYFSDE